jgi:hypothetical protein
MLVAAAAAGGLTLLGLMTAAGASAGTYTSGAWTLTAPSTDSYSAQVQQPINPDGSSVWSAKKGVIPVQFKLYDTKSFKFESLYGATTVDNGLYSSASYVPPSGTTVSQITSLIADYTWQGGVAADHDGALRWSITTDIPNPKGGFESLFVYYGDYPNFTAESGGDGSATNLLSLTDQRVDTTQFGGAFYDTWAHASDPSYLGNDTVTSISLVLDAGWAGDQVMNLTDAQVVVNGATSTFTMPASTTSQTTAPAMFIDIVKGTSSDPGTVDETTYTGVGDTSGQFAVVDGKYKYNLSTSSLSGAGTYTVYMTPDTDANRIASGGTFVLK